MKKIILTATFAMMMVFAGTTSAGGVKVDVCHVPPEDPDNMHTITISENAVDSHLSHGDWIGNCEDPGQVVCPEICDFNQATLRGFFQEFLNSPPPSKTSFDRTSDHIPESFCFDQNSENRKEVRIIAEKLTTYAPDDGSGSPATDFDRSVAAVFTISGGSFCRYEVADWNLLDSDDGSTWTWRKQAQISDAEADACRQVLRQAALELPVAINVCPLPAP